MENQQRHFLRASELILRPVGPIGGAEVFADRDECRARLVPIIAQCARLPWRKWVLFLIGGGAGLGAAHLLVQQTRQEEVEEGVGVGFEADVGVGLAGCDVGESLVIDIYVQRPGGAG